MLVHRQFSYGVVHQDMRGLTPEVQKQIINLLVRGNFRNVTARAVGLQLQAFNEYIKLGEQGQEPYKTFYELVCRAEAYAESNLVDIWRQQANMSWQAISTFLARRFPERWSQTTTIEHTGKVDVRHTLEGFHQALDEAKEFEQGLLVDSSFVENSTEVGPSAQQDAGEVGD